MATDQLLRLSSPSDSLDLYTWVNRGPGMPGLEALAEVKGFGITGQTNHWFEGAGDGATYRGSRILPREIELPIFVREIDRSKLNDLMSRISQIVSPRLAPARLDFGLPGGETWYTYVVRESGGDYVRRSKDSNNQTWYKTVLMFKAGDPFWTRTNSTNFIVTQDTSGRGLLPNLAELQVSFSGAFGQLTVTNPGDSPTKPFWTLNGPFTHVQLIGPNGEQLVWNGTIAAGKKLYIDVRNSTVIDSDGVNRYDGLSTSPAPIFWRLDPGQSPVTVVMDGTTVASYALCQFWPRRWGVI